MNYDMRLYRSKRTEVAEYTDRQITFRALAWLMTYPDGVKGGFEYHQALIDDLLRRADDTPQGEPGDIIAVLRASTEFGELTAAIADFLELLREKRGKRCVNGEQTKS